MATSTPTDQRAGVRPISFALEYMGSMSQPITLPIRPEDLSRVEPTRAAIHQTLGRDVSGWVDDFGVGLPQVSISGTTGWRGGETLDGAQSFEQLNNLIQQVYPNARQALVDAGLDPKGAKLIFADTLDGFVYPVHPTQFVLRRSKSRPLLFQYQIQLQATALSIDNPGRFLPNLGDKSTGIVALDAAIATITGFAGKVEGWVSSAVSFVDRTLAPVGKIVSGFVTASNAVFSAALSIQKGLTTASNSVINLARDMAKVGRNTMNTISTLEGLPSTAKANIQRIARAYNDVFCLFSNSLRAKKTVPDYGDLYGASNCSSTTGGSAISAVAGQNVLSQIVTAKSTAVAITPAAAGSVARVSASDPVLAPMSVRELGGHLTVINGGLAVAA